MDSSVTTRHGVSAIVEHEYTAKEPDELNLIKGAIIQNIKIQTGGWWEGKLVSGKIGMFPDNFVRVLEPDDKNPVVLREKSATINRRCKAIYSYTQNNNDELTLAVGDNIEFLGEVEEGWWRGKLGSRIGVFPSNFVTVVENVSPMLANRRSISGNNHNTNTNNNSNNSNSNNINNSNLSLRNRNRSLSNSREDLLLSNSSLEKDAPSLPPKPIREQCKVLFAYSAANEDELELKEGDIITVITKELPDKGWWKGEIRGRIGVFPDNFVLAIPSDVSPAKEIHNHNNNNHHHQQKPERPPQSLIPASKSSHLNHINTVKTNRKDIFGSKDSLNDTTTTAATTTTKTITSNVAQYRKSLDNKLLDNATAAEKHSSAIIKQQQKSSAYSDLRKSLDNLDDKKSSSPPPVPPVLTKKPTIPIKKSPTVGSVASNLFSGFKQKSSSSNKPGDNNKLMSHDSFDGLGSSKLSDNNNNNDKIHDHHHQHQLGKDDSIEFDNVERNSILQDMRAGRAKAPKRRPPTTTANSLGESNNVSYVNGTSDLSVNSNGSAGGGHDSFTKSLDGSNDEDGSQSQQHQQQQVKPKPREWEKQKAPWMAELKASQAKKGPPPSPLDSKSTTTVTSISTSSSSSSSSVSTSLEQHKSLEYEQNLLNEKYDMSKSFSTSHVISSVTSASATAFTSTSSSITTSSASSSSASAATIVNHKKIHDNSTNLEIRNHNIDGKNIIQNDTGLSSSSLSSKRSLDDNLMIKSMSSISGTKIRISDNGDDKQQQQPRPNSINARSNRSASPLKNSGLTSNTTTAIATTTATTTTATTVAGQRLIGKTNPLSSSSSIATISTTSSTTSTAIISSSSSSNTTIPPSLNSTKISLNNSQSQSPSSNPIHSNSKIGGDIPKCNNANPIVPIHLENVCPRVLELEQRIFNLERFVHIQNLTITELLKSVKDESERVQQLKGELEKYAQCVTQV